MYDKSSDLYNKAEAEERRVERRGKEMLQKELLEEKREKERVVQLSQDQAEKIKRLESEREALGVKKKQEEITSGRGVEIVKKSVMSYFGSLKAVLRPGVLQIKVAEEPDDSSGVGFSLQNFFDKLYDSTRKEDKDVRLALFGNYDDKVGGTRIARLLLADWKITYESKVVYEKSDKGETSNDYLFCFVTTMFLSQNLLTPECFLKNHRSWTQLLMMVEFLASFYQIYFSNYPLCVFQ